MSTLTALVIESESSFVSLYEVFLRKSWKWEVELVSNVEEARRAVANREFDVCFSRTDRFKREGELLCRDLRAQQDIPVIVAVSVDGVFPEELHADVYFDLNFLQGRMEMLRRRIEHIRANTLDQIPYHFTLAFLTYQRAEEVLGVLAKHFRNSDQFEDYIVELVNVLVQPERSEELNVTATPLLIRTKPTSQRFVGDFSSPSALQHVIVESV